MHMYVKKNTPSAKTTTMNMIHVWSTISFINAKLI